jgi:hypothetical protein
MITDFSSNLCTINDKDMATQINIKGIYFLSSSQEVSIVGTIQQGLFSYPSEIVTDHSGLNLVMNHLQQLNPEMDVYGQLESFHNGATHFYEMRTTALENTQIETAFLSAAKPYRELRA